MHDDAELTDAEIDELFERTQAIGDAVNAVAEAELTVAAVDDLPPDVKARLDRITRDVLGQAGG